MQQNRVRVPLSLCSANTPRARERKWTERETPPGEVSPGPLVGVLSFPAQAWPVAPLPFLPVYPDADNGIYRNCIGAHICTARRQGFGENPANPHRRERKRFVWQHTEPCRTTKVSCFCSVKKILKICRWLCLPSRVDMCVPPMDRVFHCLHRGKPAGKMQGDLRKSR